MGLLNLLEYMPSKNVSKQMIYIVVVMDDIKLINNYLQSIIMYEWTSCGITLESQKIRHFLMIRVLNLACTMQFTASLGSAPLTTNSY